MRKARGCMANLKPCNLEYKSNIPNHCIPDGWTGDFLKVVLKRRVVVWGTSLHMIFARCSVLAVCWAHHRVSRKTSDCIAEHGVNL